MATFNAGLERSDGACVTVCVVNKHLLGEVVTTNTNTTSISTSCWLEISQVFERDSSGCGEKQGRELVVAVAVFLFARAGGWGAKAC